MWLWLLLLALPVANGEVTNGEVTYFPEHKVLICVCAKCGSTSVYKWMYEALLGKPWNFTGPPWVQAVDSKRWEGVGVRGLASDKEGALFRDPSVYRLAVVRDPRERYISAWKDKVFKIACRLQTKRGWSTGFRSTGEVRARRRSK